MILCKWISPLTRCLVAIPIALASGCATDWMRFPGSIPNLVGAMRMPLRISEEWSLSDWACEFSRRGGQGPRGSLDAEQAAALALRWLRSEFGDGLDIEVVRARQNNRVGERSCYQVHVRQRYNGVMTVGEAYLQIVGEDVFGGTVALYDFSIEHVSGSRAISRDEAVRMVEELVRNAGGGAHNVVRSSRLEFVTGEALAPRDCVPAWLLECGETVIVEVHSGLIRRG